MPRVQTTITPIEEKKPKIEKKRRVISIITPINPPKEEPKQIEEVKQIPKIIDKTKQIQNDNQIEVDDFELFEDTSAGTKIVPRKKVETHTKLTKTQVQVQKKANEND